MVSNASVAQKITEKHQTEKDYSQKQRDAMDDSDFGDPSNQAFPIKTAQDVINAASRLHNTKGDEDAIKARIKRIAKRKGFPLPQTWQDDDKPKEASIPTQTMQSKTRVARIKSFFLEDDAISLNGRQYPREAVDRLIQSAQVQLSNPDALPLTCYLSHDDADRDATKNIVGKITDIGREGNKAYAYIDIPDTTAGRDAATLVRGKYIKSQSLRASGAEMRLDRDHPFPLVSGNNLKLEGIDFTTTPGLPQVARIADIQESHEPQKINEIFHSSPALLLLEELEGQKDINMDKNETELKEEEIKSTTSGTTVGMTNDPPRDDYSTRMYRMPPDVDPDMYPGALDDLRDVHDRVAFVTGLECGPTTMEARRRFGEDVIKEAKEYQSLLEVGAKFNTKTKQHLLKAHDGVAKHLGMECSGASSGVPSSTPSDDNMQDGDDDDKATSESKGLTKQDVEKLLQESGYTKQPDPKPSENQGLTKQDVEKLLRESGYVRKSDFYKPAPQTHKEPVKEAKKPMTPEDAVRLLAEAGYKIEAPKSKEQLLQEQLEEHNRRIEEQKKAFEEQQKQLTETIAEQQKQIAENQQKQFEELKKMLEQKQNTPFAAMAQRKSLVEGANVSETPAKKPYYRPGDYLKEQLRTMDRGELLDRSRPWPEWMSGEKGLERVLGELQVEYLGLYDAMHGLTPDGPTRFWQ